MRVAVPIKQGLPGGRSSRHFGELIIRQGVSQADWAVADGEKAALHRTYLAADGDKANVSSPRKMMGSMPSGAAVRLMPYTNVIGIAEGIEKPCRHPSSTTFLAGLR